MDDPVKDLGLSMYAASKLEAERDVLLCGRSRYWNVKNQLKLFGLDESPGGKKLLKMLSDQAEASAFSYAQTLDRIAPLVAGSAIKFSVVNQHVVDSEDPTVIGGVVSTP